MWEWIQHWHQEGFHHPTHDVTLVFSETESQLFLGQRARTTFIVSSHGNKGMFDTRPEWLIHCTVFLHYTDINLFWPWDHIVSPLIISKWRQLFFSILTIPDVLPTFKHVTWKKCSNFLNTGTNISDLYSKFTDLIFISSLHLPVT